MHKVSKFVLKMPVSIVSSPDSASCKVHEFSVENDIVLLQEKVHADDNPSRHAGTHKSWVIIARNTATTRLAGLTSRAVKERTDKIGKEYTAKDNWRAKQSGTDEQHTRKNAPLMEALSFFEKAAIMKQE